MKKITKFAQKSARWYMLLLMPIFIILAMAIPVFAAYNYVIPIQVANNSTTAYPNGLPILIPLDNDQLVTEDFILATGLDIDVQEGSSIPFSVSSDYLGIFTDSLAASQTKSFSDYLGFTPNATGYPIITGVGGNITTADHDSIEPGADFTIDYSGYIDTSAGNVGEIIAEKENSVSLWVSSAGNIDGGISSELSIIPMTPSANIAPAIGAWSDVDCTGLGVPDSASGVVIHVVNSSAGALGYGLRKNGSTDNRHEDIYLTTHTWAMIGTDANGIFEAWIDEYTDILMYVTGYTNPDTVVFNTNGIDKSLAATGAWTDIDCSAIAPNAKAILVEVVNTGAVYDAGLRPNGSASEVTYGDYFMTAHNFYLVGCDASQIIEGKIENAAVDFYVIGYITDGIVMFTDPVDKSLGGTGAYADIDCSANTTANTTGLIFSVTETGTAYALRKNGSAEDLYFDSYNTGAPMAIIECDASQIVEGKIENVATDFWLWGYFGERTVDVVTSACVSGEHDIRLDYDGANLDLFIDNMVVPVDTAAALSAPPNTNDWIFGSNATPYIDSITLNIGIVDRLWYEPVTIITADTAVDRSGSANHGDINWGANPADIEITVFAITSATDWTAGSDGASVPDPLPIPSSFNQTATNTTGIASLWLYDLVNRAAEHLGFSAQTMYAIIGIIMATGVGFGALIGTGNMLGFTIGFGATGGLFVTSGVMPWWMITITIAIVAMGIYVWRRG